MPQPCAPETAPRPTLARWSHRRSWLATTLALVGLATTALSAPPADAAPRVASPTAAPAPAAVPTDTGLTVTSKGVVSHEAAGTGAYEPALTRAANGDLVVAYPTSTDSNAGGLLRVTRSSDNGATWTTPVTIYTPHVFPGSSVGMSVGMTTLADGTILLPFNDGVNYSPFRNRDSVLYVAKSTDNGATWTGTDTPVTFPVSVREQWAYGKILQQPDGDLVMPLWGSRKLTPDWQKKPKPWNAAVLRSTDDGVTWSQYATVATDQNLPPLTPYAGGPNETTLVPLADGRLLAVIRFASPYPGEQPTYVSYSSDGGRTWTKAQAGLPSIQSPSAAVSPCTADLPAGRTKVVLGYRNLTDPYSGAPALSVSYDNGLTWQGKMFLQDPDGTALGGYVGSYPAFADLGGGRLFTVFMEKAGTGDNRVAFNVLQDASASDCQQAAAAVASANASTTTVFLQRADRAVWPFPYALKRGSWPSSTTVGTIASAIGDAVTCNQSGVVLRMNGRVLDQSKTLAQNLVTSGDVITVSAAPAPNHSASIGLRDYDTYPDDAPLAMWADHCDYRAAFDARGRSLGIHTPSGRGAVTAVHLRATGSSSRLTASSLSVWASSDNKTFTQVTGWTYTQTLVSGHLVASITGLSVNKPYLKIHQSFKDDAFTFVIGSMRNDVTVDYAR